MLSQQTLMKRIIWAKAFGFVVGLMAYLTIPMFMPDAGLQLRFAFWAWYLTLGGFIGVAGVIDQHPLLKLPLPFWVRGPFIGAWMNFVLVLFAYDDLSEMLVAANTAFGTNVGSPYWIVIEGAVIGLLIDGMASMISKAPASKN